MDKNPEVSIIVPAYNESEGILEFISHLGSELEKCCELFEICVVDDGSTDSTWDKLIIISKNQPNLRAVRFTRNFGKEAAILAGLRESRGSAVIIIDADGQHPVHLIPEMLFLWRTNNSKIIAARKTNKPRHFFLTRANANIFNKFMFALTGLNLKGSSDFKLLDRNVVNTILSFPEKVRFFRGMTVWTGFSTTHLDFEVSPRIAGKSKWNQKQLIHLATNAITAYSAKPLILVFRLGVFGMLIAALLIAQAIYSWFTKASISGWTSLTLVIVFFGSANLLGLGILGIYLSQVFNEIKQRPGFLISERLGSNEVQLGT